MTDAFIKINAYKRLLPADMKLAHVSVEVNPARR